MSKIWELLASQEPSIDVSPVLQTAADGQWEQARFAAIPGDVQTARAAVAQTAAGAQRHLAIEIVWPGTMFVGSAWPADRHAEAVEAAARALAALGDGHQAEPAMTGLTALLGAKPEGEIESAELGAVNAWLSVGPEHLWRQGETYSAATVDAALDNRPTLMTCTHPVAVEFSISEPRRCWAAIIVSTQQGDAHHLNRQRLHEVLATIIEPSP